MNKIFNTKKLQDKRKKLRKNMTEAETILWSAIKNKQIRGGKNSKIVEELAGSIKTLKKVINIDKVISKAKEKYFIDKIL